MTLFLPGFNSEFCLSVSLYSFLFFPSIFFSRSSLTLIFLTFLRQSSRHNARSWVGWIFCRKEVEFIKSEINHVQADRCVWPKIRNHQIVINQNRQGKQWKQISYYIRHSIITTDGWPLMVSSDFINQCLHFFVTSRSYFFHLWCTNYLLGLRFPVSPFSVNLNVPTYALSNSHFFREFLWELHPALIVTSQRTLLITIQSYFRFLVQASDRSTYNGNTLHTSGPFWLHHVM